VALKIALQYFFNQDEPQRKTFIAFEGAYHGDTFGAMSVGARGIFNQPFESLFFDVKFIPLPCENNFEKALSLFETYCETGEVAGFIFEPLVQGSAGMRMYRAEYLDELIKTAKKHGVLCIADEVMTGFGRTGKYFACQYLSEKVDVMCLSKGITGGFMPFGATLIHSKIVRVFRGETFARSFLHGHSYTGSPLACALAAESLRLLRSEAVQNDIQRISDSHAAFVKKIRNHRALADARSLGTVMAAEIKTEEKTGYFNSKRGDLSKFFMQRDILLRPLGNVIYILPPYCADETALHKTYDAVEELLEAL
jgi:adenosylmethionine-8-amino-7-oxononanoate aminotransferase